MVYFQEAQLPTYCDMPKLLGIPSVGFSAPAYLSIVDYGLSFQLENQGKSRDLTSLISKEVVQRKISYFQ